MIKRVTHANLGPIWYHSELSNVPYSPNQFLGLDFFCRFLQQTGSKAEFKWKIQVQKVCMYLIKILSQSHDGWLRQSCFVIGWQVRNFWAVTLRIWISNLNFDFVFRKLCCTLSTVLIKIMYLITNWKKTTFHNY